MFIQIFENNINIIIQKVIEDVVKKFSKLCENNRNKF